MSFGTSKVSKDNTQISRDYEYYVVMRAPAVPYLFRLLVLSLFLMFHSLASAQTKCEANINGFKIRTIYITGNQYNGVVWAYKNLSEYTCLTPVTDLEHADAVLDVYDRNSSSKPGIADSPLSVTCFTAANSTSCRDSTGNLMTIDCRGATCTSYYGRDPTITTLHALNQWVLGAWYQAEINLYTTDHKLLWRSIDYKGSWLNQWPDKLREATNSPSCKRPSAGSFEYRRLKTYRLWATQKCGVTFDPAVSIDIKLNNSQPRNQNSQEQMMKNAKDAAAKQSENH